MPTNVVLVRWSGGHHERYLPGSTLSPRRIEGGLGLGAARSENEVDRIADKQLDIFSNERAQITVEIEPDQFPIAVGATPYLGIRVGDTALLSGPGFPESRERLLSVTVTEDELGHPMYATDWRDVIYEGQDAFAQWLKKMANGTLGGASKPATPASQVNTSQPTCCPPLPPEPVGTF